ncbi:MAG: homoserine dehydrogenase [Actinomycetota bacterium]|nr:homoserine dehydrogenase [Actinomycetota bacterium]
MIEDTGRRDASVAPSVRVGVLGCGNVGGALVEILDEDADGIAARTGVRLVVTRVAVRNVAKPRVASLHADRLTHDAHSVATDPDVDVVVELIGGIEPARTLIVDALRSGKPVVTANKELLANFGAELYSVARECGRDLLFEAAVAGGIPLVRALRESLAGERVRRVTGIVNGTTNYVLSRMSDERIAYGEALREAQSLGYAERDPTADVEGHDASAKAAILASIAFDADVVAGDVYREGIESIDVDDIDFAHRLGYEVKLLAVAERVGPDGPGDPAVAVRVHPAMVPRDHPLAGVRGPFNAVFVEGDAVGDLMLYGRGAGGRPTASAVLGDLVDAARGLVGGGAVWLPARSPVEVRPIDELEAQYYLTIDVLDQPGVLASVASVFGANGVSIRSMEQVGLGTEARLVLITHRAREADVQATLAGLRDVAEVERIGQLLRVVGPDR